MSFFIRSKRENSFNQNGEFHKKAIAVKKKKFTTEIPTRKKRKHTSHVEIDSDDEDDYTPAPQLEQEIESDQDVHETTQEKRLRLAKLYLSEIEKQEQERLESDVLDKDIVTKVLKEKVLEQAGKLRKIVASNYTGYDEENVKVLSCKEHKLPITCLVVSPDNEFIYSGSKDCTIVKWSLHERRKVKSIPGASRITDAAHKSHTRAILCLAISSDNKFLVSGAEDKLIIVWNVDTLDQVHRLTGHKGAVTGVVLRRGTHQLFSSSMDRSVIIWNLDEMSYVETLLGHQSGITGIDAMSRERAVTAGGHDNSVRVWKVVEESQLIYNGHRGSIDAVKLINEDHFVSCGDDGQICIWGTMKKKPLSCVANAHGIAADNQQPNWVSSVTAFFNTDLLASGSQDGFVRLWKCSNGFKSVDPVMTIPVTGFINALHFTSDGKHLVIGVGQEHRLGRWWRKKEAKNGIIIAPLLQNT